METLNQDERIEKLERELQELKKTIAAKLDLESREVDSTLEDRLSGLINQIRSQDSVFDHQPIFVLACRPLERVEVRGIFGGYREEVVRLFDNPPDQREGGFNLAVNGKSSGNVGGEYRLMSAPGYQARFLSRDGICGVIVSGGQDFMGWAMTGTPGEIRFNSLAVAEITYEFCRFAISMLKFAEPNPSVVRFYVELSGYDENKLTLALPKSRVFPSAILGSYPSSKLGDTNLRLSIDASISDAPEKTALRLIQQLYVRSGRESDMVPYADSNKEKLDIEAIVNGR